MIPLLTKKVSHHKNCLTSPAVDDNFAAGAERRINEVSSCLNMWCFVIGDLAKYLVKFNRLLAKYLVICLNIWLFVMGPFETFDKRGMFFQESFLIQWTPLPDLFRIFLTLFVKRVIFSAQNTHFTWTAPLFWKTFFSLSLISGW